jgi:hypothetical protein
MMYIGVVSSQPPAPVCDAIFNGLRRLGRRDRCRRLQSFRRLSQSGFPAWSTATVLTPLGSADRAAGFVFPTAPSSQSAPFALADFSFEVPAESHIDFLPPPVFSPLVAQVLSPPIAPMAIDSHAASDFHLM